MQFKTLTAVLAGLLFMALGCDAQQSAGHGAGNNPDVTDRWTVTYPPQSALLFPEDQVIKKEFQVTTHWQTITFQTPLKINRQGHMGLHLAVDQDPYISTMDDHPLNPDCNKPECAVDAYSLRRLCDGALVRPEAVLVGDNGVETKIRPTGHLYPYCDKNIRTINLRKSLFPTPQPGFPPGIESFTAMRIRSTEPFLVRYIWWQVDRHPDMFNR